MDNNNNVKRVLPTYKPLVTHEQLSPINKRLDAIDKKLQGTQPSPINTELKLTLHPKVLAASEKLFKDGYYSEAIFAACKSIEGYVKTKSGVKNKIGKDLMAHVFNENDPYLKIKCSHPDTAKIEQEGYKFIFMGVILGIRDPKAHYEIIQPNRIRALQYLALASLLFKTIDEATINKSSTK